MSGGLDVYQPWLSLAPSVFLQPDQGREEEPAVPGKVSAWWVGGILATGMGGAIALWLPQVSYSWVAQHLKEACKVPKRLGKLSRRAE